MADEQLIKPRELPAAAIVFADDAIMTDNGSIVGKATPVQIVNAGAPVPTEAEAIAGTDNSKRMTPLTVKQVLDNVTAPSVLRAQAWAESSTPPDPGIPGSKSAKSWATEAERLGAEQADRAEAAAAEAALYEGPWLNNVTSLLADTTLTYGPGTAHVQAGDIVRTRAEGFAYMVAVSGATDHHVATAGGVKLKVLPGDAGMTVKAFGAVGDGVTDDTAAFQAAIMASKGKRLILTVGRYLTSSTLTVPHPMILIGEGSALNDGDGTGASTILFSGTGPALQFGGAGYAIFYPNLRNLRIQATGAAITDANAIGLSLVNIHGGKFYDLAVRSFRAGIGVLCTATAGQISAGNTFWGPNLWQNFVGFKFDGAGASHPFAADYASYIFGGAAIGVDDGGLGISGSRGLWVTQWAAETQVYATDFETFDVCIDLYGDHPNTGGGVKLFGTRTEFQRTMAIRVNANTIRTQIIGHRFAGGASSTWLQNNGLRTLRLDADGNIRTNTADLELLNDIPVRLQDAGGTARTVMKMSTNNTVQIGSINYTGFNGNYGLGTWRFTAPVFENAGGASGWQNAVRFGDYRLWVDSTGKLRIKSSAPANDTDGTVVGTQT